MDSFNQKYSLTNNKRTTSDDMSENDMLVQERPTTIVYCRKCGSKMLLTDNFCPNCGLNVHDNILQEHANTNVKAENKLPMDWWKFWEYFIFPASMLLYFISIIKMLFIESISTVGPIICNFIVLIYMAVTYCFFIYRKSNVGFYIMIVYLALSTLIGASLNTTIIENICTSRMNPDEYLLILFCILIIHTVTWFLPNYIYFKKRKNYFSIDQQK